LTPGLVLWLFSLFGILPIHDRLRSGFGSHEVATDVHIWSPFHSEPLPLPCSSLGGTRRLHRCPASNYCLHPPDPLFVAIPLFAMPYVNIKQLPKALMFDVFGTCVDWRTTVTKSLVGAYEAKLKLDGRSGLSAPSLGEEQWGQFAQQWRNSYYTFCRTLSSNPDIPFTTVDEHHRLALGVLLREWGLDGFYTDLEISELSLVWHRLDPWSDSSEGIKKLSDMFTTSTLSNGNTSLLKDLACYADLPFAHVFCAEDFKTYKPNPKVYLGACGALGLEPGQCMMVACHLSDLDAAMNLGYSVAYIERPGEEAWDDVRVHEMKASGKIDVWVSSGEGGLVALADELSGVGF